MLSDDIATLLDVNDRLLVVEALSVGDVQHDVQNAYDFVQTDSPATDDEAQVRSIVIAQLQGELNVLAQEDPSAPEPADQWQRQRDAIARAYGFADRNLIDAGAVAKTSQARADLLNNAVKKAGDAAKDVGKGVTDVLGIVLAIVVLLVIAQLARKA